jgi:Ca2+-binding RTX toxin-like protein
MATPSGGSVTTSGNPLIDGLLQGNSWTFAGGQPRVITYSFNITGYGGSWTQPLIDGANAAYAAIEAVCNIDFQQISSGTYVWQSDADIAMGVTGSRQDEQWDTIGYANFPDPSENDLARADYSQLFGQTFTATTYAKPEGDILIDNYDVAYSYMATDGYGLTIFLHEILHALGLKHPHDDGGTGFPTFSQLGISGLNLDQYTVMSYEFAFPYYDIGNPSTPMVLDILALQYIYGANMTYHTGDDVYTFEDGKCYTIWDAGGNDTISAVSYGSGIALRLEAGTTNIDKDNFSTVGIAFGVTIENARGSQYYDDLMGNAADNRLYGNGDSDLLRGGDGDDWLYGGNESISDTDLSSDNLAGEGGNDRLFGGAGHDALDGGTGADTMNGGLGTDVYYVDEIGDKVAETASDSAEDKVYSWVSFALAGTGVEHLTLAGSDAIDATGSTSHNILIGNAGNNILIGGDGNDELRDIGFADKDQMFGGAGDDSYYITSLTEQAIELVGEGIDSIFTTLSTFALEATFENLAFDTVNGAIGFGNDLNNKISGGAGNDILDGGKGDDTYWGSWGSDTYYIDSQNDQVWNEITTYPGIDQAIISSTTSWFGLGGVEIYTLIGSANITAYGNDIDNTIYGNSGANYITGRGGKDVIHFGGNDTVEGGAALDSFHFTPAPGEFATAMVWDLQYLETLSWTTIQPLEGASAPILWPLGNGTGTTTLLNQLEYSTDGLHTYLHFGLDDVAGADFTITLNGIKKPLELQAAAEGNTITVKNLDVPNVAPTDILLSTPVLKISEDTAVGTVIGTLSAVDTDEVGAATFSLTDGTFGNFAIDGNKLVLAKPLDADTIVKYTHASVRATDSEGAWVLRGFQFEITDANDNAPVITSNGGSASVSLSIAEGVSDVTQVQAKDLDASSILSFAIVGGADQDRFIIDSAGKLTFKDAPDFEAPADSNKDNIYLVDIAVSDGTFSDLQSFKVNVLDALSKIIYGSASHDYFTEAATTNESDEVYGLAGNDLIRTGDGDDLLDGGIDYDMLFGGSGNDTYIVDSTSDWIYEEGNADKADLVRSSVTIDLDILGAGAIENAVLTGTAAINVFGTASANHLTGNGAANLIDGRGGADTLIGGLGSDTYLADHLADKVIEAAAAGTDHVKSSVSFTLGDHVEMLTLSGSLNIDGSGNALNNTITGNAADNRLDGQAGNDTMTAGLGNDTYVINTASDVTNEAAGAGIDTIESAITFSLATRTNIENLTLTGGALNATGSALANVLTGNSLANILDGGTGKDTMRGGAGNDFYLVDNAGDVIDEQLNSDTGDEVKSAVVRFAAIASIEHYTYTGTAAWTFVATSANNKILGGSGADKLDGADGNDTLLGNAGNDLLAGSIGDDGLDGGVGNDTMKGGAGKDTYVVNATGDKIDEEGNADVGDLVRSSISINLAVIGAGLIEDATLLGATAINATGNTAVNRLIGNDGANILDGKGGADILEGGKGADTYIIDDLGDQLTESLAGAAGGIDLVKSSVTYILGANLEKLALTETGNIDGFGNTLNNTLLGNIGDNRLDGDDGNDTMTGGKGSDIYVVDAAGDVVSETIAAGGGIDAVESSITFTLATRVNVENLELKGTGNINGTGNALANLIEGNAGHNKIDGGSGNDVLFGQAGNDTILGGLGNDTMAGGLGADQLTGGGGRDFFDFDTLLDAGDTITGFVKGATGDVLDLRDLLDSVPYAGSDPFTDQILSFSQSDGNTIVRIDADGAGAGGLTDVVTILNVSLTTADTNNFLI